VKVVKRHVVTDAPQLPYGRQPSPLTLPLSYRSQLVPTILRTVAKRCFIPVSF